MAGEYQYEVDGRQYRGYLANGANGIAAPGVLVLHGGGGLGPHVRQRTEMLAELGYVAFAADLFGEPVTGLEHAKAIVSHFTRHWRELRQRCRAALDVLRQQRSVDAERLAAVGFCFGGQAALEFARSGSELRAIVGFHSQLETERPEDSRHIKAKVLICIGDQDCFVSRADREAFMDNMTASGVDTQLLVFSGIGHSFMDPFAQSSGVPGIKYDARAAARAWLAMQSLFSETLDSNQGFFADEGRAL